MEKPTPYKAGAAGSWLQTFSGRRVWPLDPNPEDLVIGDIAHALAHQCRFAGHTSRFYSVAQHSVRVSFIVPPGLALCGLMHDASEAFLVDIPRPIKHLLPQYLEAEDRLMGVLAERFGFSWPLPVAVKKADDIMLAAEARALIAGKLDDWPLPVLAPGTNTCEALGGFMPADEAEVLFLARFAELAGGAVEVDVKKRD